ncbi:hypothetical protein LOCC1_G003983 [Lachnellula occidentalis]|uniref:Uncharacterized protein n=1 Tax=Lachnellula occidentalis TaxID=215460 RepID=A0A8H8UEE7_9HELO|nr:hypothetical protein LOCC1_G003983 [Lachnellula occidentalis]
MTSRTIRDIAELRTEDLELLAQLLSLQIGATADETWLRDQARLIAAFPPRLRRPESFLSRVGLSLPFTPDKAHLCKTHKTLQPQLIRSIFIQVTAECTTRVARLLDHPVLPENVSQFLKRIQSLNSLWMSPDFYLQAFNVNPWEARFQRLPGGCEACILAAVGGNLQSLTDLRTSMLGRKKKRGPMSRLLPLVENWIEWTGRDTEVRRESDALAREIRDIRSQLQHARRQLRRNIANGIVDQESEPEQGASPDVQSLNADDGDHTEHTNEDDDFEGSIIDFYANIMSTTNLVERSQHTDDLHPAFRDSIVFDPASGTFGRTVAQAPRQRAPTAYSESVYSQSTRAGPSRGHAHQTDPRGYSDHHARAYEALTGHSDMGSSLRQREVGRRVHEQNRVSHPGIDRDEGFESATTAGTSRHTRVTRMSDLQ